MNIFKSPCQTVMNSPLPDETILIFMYYWNNDILHSVSQDLCDDLERYVDEGDRSEIIDCFI